MHKLFTLAIVLMLIAAVAAQSPGDDGQVTIGAFNIENAFDVFDDPYTLDEEQDVKPREEWKRIAETIGRLDADVLGVTEVENEHVLRAMAEEFLPGAGYRYFAVLPTNADRGINVGVMSRLPIERTAIYRHAELKLPGDERTWQFARGLLQVTVDVPGEEHLELFVVHFKSRRDSDGDPNSRSWRLAEQTEAARIIGGILEEDPKALVAMVGDFNDTPETPGIAALLGTGLKDAHAGLSEAQRITYLREPYRTTIDYVLVSPALAGEMVPRSARVLNETDPGSDHAPVAATFDLD